MGPSSRRGALVISEVMYHPAERTDGRNVEFIEVYNTLPWYEDLSGYKISGAVDYTFPSNFILGARSYAVVAAIPADMQNVYGITNALGPWSGLSEQFWDATAAQRSRRGFVRDGLHRRPALPCRCGWRGTFARAGAAEFR